MSTNLPRRIFVAHAITQRRLRAPQPPAAESLGSRCPQRLGGSLALPLFLLAALCPAFVFAADRPLSVESRRGMVVSVSPDASDAGLDVLKDGGNAVDAAITVALALAVTFPEAGNIGGGGFMMVWPGGERPPVCVEYRETCPAALSRDSFVKERRQSGHHTVGVPGTVRGLALAHQEYGRLPWSRLVEPAVRLAEQGFAIDAALAAALNKLVKETTGSFPEFVRVYGKPSGGAWQAGDRLIQPDLAKSLQILATEGASSFYVGRLAEQIVAEMQADGGMLTADDLRHYRAHLRRPVHTNYRGYDVYAPPPPSAGGTQLVQALNILETFDLRAAGNDSPQYAHLVAEAMRRAGCDRVRHMGDPGFMAIPGHLTTKDYAKRLAAEIDPHRATPSRELAPELNVVDERPSTTHFSVADGDGMAVANTYTLQNSWGSRVVVRGGGFLLNNEMTDFNWQPGRTTTSGDVGTEPNVMAPGKRMLSSQCPTLVAKDGQLRLVTGSPGGRTIPSTVLNVLLQVVDFDQNARDAVDAPRWHHQWFPDRLQYERINDPAAADLITSLKQMGHSFGDEVQKLGDGYRRQGDAHTILIRDGLLTGAADWRRTTGKAAGW